MKRSRPGEKDVGEGSSTPSNSSTSSFSSTTSISTSGGANPIKKSRTVSSSKDPALLSWKASQQRQNITINHLLPQVGIQIKFDASRNNYVYLYQWTDDVSSLVSSSLIRRSVPLEARLTAVNNESTKNLNTHEVISLIGKNRPVLLTFDWSDETKCNLQSRKNEEKNIV